MTNTLAESTMPLVAFLPNLGVAELLVICILPVVFAIMLLPVFIAVKRGHPNTAAIVALDLLLGWTFLGWVAALVWSLTAFDQHVRREM